MQVLRDIKPHLSKIRVLANKSDLISLAQLVRAGANLSWNLSRVVDTSEAPKVCLFGPERHDIYSELTVKLIEDC